MSWEDRQHRERVAREATEERSRAAVLRRLRWRDEGWTLRELARDLELPAGTIGLPPILRELERRGEAHQVGERWRAGPAVRQTTGAVEPAPSGEGMAPASAAGVPGAGPETADLRGPAFPADAAGTQEAASQGLPAADPAESAATTAQGATPVPESTMPPTNPVLSEDSIRILAYVAEHPGCTAPDVRDAFRDTFPQPTAAVRLTQFAERGFVERCGGAGGRDDPFRYELTAKGAARLGKVPAPSSPASPELSPTPPASGGASEETAVHVDDARCPECGSSLKWSCGDATSGGRGYAHCQNGRQVSRRLDAQGREGHGEPCAWPGVRVRRLGPMDIVIDGPLVRAERAVDRADEAHERETSELRARVEGLRRELAEARREGGEAESATDDAELTELRAKLAAVDDALGLTGDGGARWEGQRGAELQSLRLERDEAVVAKITLGDQMGNCLTAAQGWTSDPVREGMYGWSPAYQATINLCTDLEATRAERDALAEQVRGLRAAVEPVDAWRLKALEEQERAERAELERVRLQGQVLALEMVASQPTSPAGRIDAVRRIAGPWQVDGERLSRLAWGREAVVVLREGPEWVAVCADYLPHTRNDAVVARLADLRQVQDIADAALRGLGWELAPPDEEPF